MGLSLLCCSSDGGIVLSLSMAQLYLTQTQIRELLDLVHLGGHVRAIAREALRQGVGESEHMLEDEIIAQGLVLGVDGVTLDADGKAAHADTVLDTLHATLAEYDDERFWDVLEERLSVRDFERTKTRADQDTIDTTHRMPPRIATIFQHYTDEFELYGIDRLEINTDAPVSDVRDLL